MSAIANTCPGPLGMGPYRYSPKHGYSLRSEYGSLRVGPLPMGPLRMGPRIWVPSAWVPCASLGALA